jgi:ribosomal protein L12E/L44/L45/RPP1/RPP2
LSQDILLERFKVLLESDNPHLQAHIRGFLDAMESMHAGVRPAKAEAPVATFQGSSLGEVLGKVAQHISAASDPGKDVEDVEPGKGVASVEDDKASSGTGRAAIH